MLHGLINFMNYESLNIAWPIASIGYIIQNIKCFSQAILINSSVNIQHPEIIIMVSKHHLYFA